MMEYCIHKEGGPRDTGKRQVTKDKANMIPCVYLYG